MLKLLSGDLPVPWLVQTPSTGPSHHPRRLSSVRNPRYQYRSRWAQIATLISEPGAGIDQHYGSQILDVSRMLLTSGGIAMAHMATPAVPPAMITRPMLRSEDDALAGVSAFFVTS